MKTAMERIPTFYRRSNRWPVKVYTQWCAGKPAVWERENKKELWFGVYAYHGVKYSHYSQSQATTTFNNRSCELVGASSNIPLTKSDSTKMFESGYGGGR